METIRTCPLGHTCEKAVDGKVERCRWFVRVQGMDPQTGQSVDKDDCAITWLPILTIEMSRTNRGQTAALESFRNEMVKDNQTLQRAIAEGGHAFLPSQ